MSTETKKSRPLSVKRRIEVMESIKARIASMFRSAVEDQIPMAHTWLLNQRTFHVYEHVAWKRLTVYDRGRIGGYFDGMMDSLRPMQTHLNLIKMPNGRRYWFFIDCWWYLRKHKDVAQKLFGLTRDELENCGEFFSHREKGREDDANFENGHFVWCPKSMLTDKYPETAVRAWIMERLQAGNPVTEDELPIVF